MRLGIFRIGKKYLPKAIKIFACLAIVGSSLLYFPQNQQKVEAASNFTFPKLGVDTLKDPEGYEKATLITTVGIVLSGSNAARTEVLDKSYYGFSLSGDFSDVTLKVKKSNGTYTDLLKAENDDTFYGSNTGSASTSKKSSVLYAFPEGVSEIEFYYSGTKDFSILKYEFSASTPKTTAPTEYASTAAETNYKEKLFSEMGFNLITREEWGAPTASPWNPNVVHVNRVVVHHTATSVDMANPKNTVMSIYNFHYNKCSDNSGSWPNCADPSMGTWTDIGYNYLIDPYGNIYEGRAGGNGVVGAHAVPNTGSIGIAILGNYVSQQPTQATVEALTRLVSAVTQLNDFDATWHGGDPKSGTGLYGHRDVDPVNFPTACPGTTLYSKLPTVASLAVQMKPSNAKLKEVNQESRDLVNSREYLTEGTSAQLILDSTGLSPIVKEKLLTESRGVTDVKEVGNTIIYEAKNVLVNQLIAETLLVAPTTKIQPNFIYHLDSWDNSDSNRSVSSDYDATTQWNLEKVKATEAWKNLGGCVSDNSCGGSQSTVVAVLDTGLSYENFDYDAGDDDTYTSEKFSGLFIEYPTDSTQDGTFVNGSFAGYEREFDQSSEMNGVNIVSPHDAVQDYFCVLRSLDVDSANNCNANETAKIGHPNDDYGHGTFVTTIIAGKTSDSAPNKVVGIGHNLSIMPIKVFYPTDKSMCQDAGGNLDLTCSYSARDYRAVGDSYVITQAINYAVANGADVINMSLRGNGTDPQMQAAITDAVNAGVIVVVSAGNDNANVSNYFPAGFSNVITVGATNSSDARASYSNFGAELDLVAPVGDSGSKIASQTFSCFPSISTCSGESTEALFGSFTSNSSPTTGTGTSFSTPQVAAAVGLMKSIKPSLNQSDALRILTATATDVGTVGRDDNTGYGILNIDQAVANIWSDWNVQPGDSISEVTMSLFGSNLYQAIRGLSSKVYTRSSADGVTWSSWVLAPGESADEVKMAVFGGKIYQAIRGTNNRVYTRSSSDGTNWSTWDLAPGESAGNVNMVVFGGNLYQTIRGTNNRIYVRYSADGTSWTAWYANAGETAGDVLMAVFGGKLYQAIRGTNNRIYTRDSTGGTNWSTWRSEPGESAGDVNMEVLGSNLYQAIRGTNNRIYTRYSADGTIWSAWTSEPGETAGNVNMEAFDGKLYQVIRGTNNGVYTRYSSNGTTWSYWLYSDMTNDNVSISSIDFGSGAQLFEARRGTDNKVNTRHLE